MLVIKKLQQWLRTHPLDIILLGVVAGVGLWMGLQASVIILDDAMITFRVAENLAYGRGFVYNVGERVQVTTTPLYAMTLAVGTWLFGSAPRAALALNIALSTIIPVLTFDVGRRLGGRITAVGAALLISMMPLLVIAFSMESYLYVALILASLIAYCSQRFWLAGMLVGITALVRGDGVLLGASMLSYDFLITRRLRWRLILPAVLIPAMWYLFATFYYGSPFPATLAAKTAQGEFDWLGKRFLSGFGGYWTDWLQLYSPLFYLFPPLLIIGIIHAVWSDHRWLILIGREALYIGAFVGLGVTFAKWYYAPLMPAIALLTAHGVQTIAQFIGRLRAGRQQKANSAQPQSIWQPYSIATVLIATLLITIYPVTRDIIRANPDWKAQTYPDAGRWIAHNTNASANLATIDIGHLGYWSKRRIIDIVGLAQPDVAPHIAEGDFGYAIRQYEPDMVLVGASWLPEIQGREWFQADYTPRHALKFDGLDEPLILFSRHQGVKIHSQVIPPVQIQPLQIDFNQQITLTGYQINQPVAPGDILNLNLFWQVEAPLDVDFTTFVQLVDSANSIIAQDDNKPQGGFYPTQYWQPGEQVIDNYLLPLDAAIPSGSYDIILGLYEADNGNRLQILNKAGEFESDHVRIPNIQVAAP